MKSKQEIFDFVIGHLRKQGVKSQTESGSHCLYRSEDGNSCAVGCLISDEDYKPRFDDVDQELPLQDTSLAGQLKVPDFVQALRNSGVDIEDEVQLDQLEDLQCMHDDLPNTAPHDSRFHALLEESAKDLAGQFNLTYTPPKESA